MGEAGGMEPTDVGRGAAIPIGMRTPGVTVHG
jgi:hypothetical protein